MTNGGDDELHAVKKVRGVVVLRLAKQMGEYSSSDVLLKSLKPEVLPWF
jgi:hypothetical protein